MGLFPLHHLHRRLGVLGPDNVKTPFYDNDTISQLVSFVALCLYLWFDSIRKSARTAE